MTILAASQIDHLITSSPEHAIAFFFFAATAEARDDPLAVLRTWTSQLVTLSNVAIKLAADHFNDKGTNVASSSEVWGLFTATVQNIPHSILVVDGLDEGVQADDRRTSFLAQLKLSVAHTSSRLIIVRRAWYSLRYLQDAARGRDQHRNLAA